MAYTSTIEEDYIDIEMIPSSNLLCYTIKSPPQSREFEFQMCSSISDHTQTTTSPADELFYKGKLLPLHLPPRLQMVRNLIHHDDNVGIAVSCNADAREWGNANGTTSSVMESRTISPSESRRVSNEMNPDEYFFEWSTELTSFINTNDVKKPLSKKVKRTYLGQKLKASRAYLMSLFTKSGCSNESCVKPANNVEPEAGAIKGKDCLLNYIKARSRKNQSCGSYEYNNEKDNTSSNSLIKSIEREMAHEDLFIAQRKSFSGAIQLHSASSSGSVSSSSSSSSSSFSFGSNGISDLQFLKRSSSASSEIESSIQGAIAHCKMSQQQVSSPKKDSEVGEGRKLGFDHPPSDRQVTSSTL